MEKIEKKKNEFYDKSVGQLIITEEYDINEIVEKVNEIIVILNDK